MVKARRGEHVRGAAVGSFDEQPRAASSAPASRAWRLCAAALATDDRHLAERQLDHAGRRHAAIERVGSDAAPEPPSQPEACQSPPAGGVQHDRVAGGHDRRERSRRAASSAPAAPSRRAPITSAAARPAASTAQRIRRGRSRARGRGALARRRARAERAAPGRAGCGGAGAPPCPQAAKGLGSSAIHVISTRPPRGPLRCATGAFRAVQPRRSSSITCATALISARCVNACGKLPRWRPLRASSSSA